MARAIQWLQSSPLSIKEIAARLAYPDPQSFSRAFRQMTGRPPSAYRSHIPFSEKDRLR